MRTQISVVVLILVATVAALAGPQATKTAGVPDPRIIDAQDFQKLLERNHGKAVLVNFWATWCEPCRDEYPMLNELAKQYAPQGLKVVGVSMDDDGDLILMRRFLARYKPVFPNYRKKAGEEEAFRQAVFPGWNGTLPATYFYAKDGKLTGHFFGEREREAYESVIRTMLSGGSN